MRTLQIFESISVDGNFTDQNSDMSWAHAGREDPELREMVEDLTTLLLGSG